MKQRRKKNNARCTGLHTHYQHDGHVHEQPLFWRFPWVSFFGWTNQEKVSLSPLISCLRYLFTFECLCHLFQGLCCRFLPYIHHPTWRYGRDDVPNAQNLNKVNQPLAELTNHQHLLPYPIILCSNKHLHHNQNNEKNHSDNHAYGTSHDYKVLTTPYWWTQWNFNWLPRSQQSQRKKKRRSRDPRNNAA